MVPAVALWCAECLLVADDRARSWRLLRVDVPGDDEPLLAAYCPACAERELGVLPRRYEPPWLEDGLTF
jgi:hypothetical protein